MQHRVFFPPLSPDLFLSKFNLQVVCHWSSVIQINIVQKVDRGVPLFKQVNVNKANSSYEMQPKNEGQKVQTNCCSLCLNIV